MSNLSNFLKHNFITNTTASMKSVTTLFTGKGDSYGVHSSKIISVCGSNVVGVGDIYENNYPNDPQLQILGEGYIDALGVFHVSRHWLTIYAKVLIDGNQVVEIGGNCSSGKGIWVIGAGTDGDVSRCPLFFKSSFEVYVTFDDTVYGNKGSIGFSGGLF